MLLCCCMDSTHKVTIETSMLCPETTSKSKTLRSQAPPLGFVNALFDNEPRGVNFSSLGTGFQVAAQQLVRTECLCLWVLNSNTGKCTSPSTLAEVLCSPQGAKGFPLQLRKDHLDFPVPIVLCLVSQVSTGYSSRPPSVCNELDTVLLSEQFSPLQSCFCLRRAPLYSTFSEQSSAPR